jgi:hypothetical protein
MVTPAAKREAGAHVRSAFELSERRACRIIGCVRMTVRYCSRRPRDIELRERLRALAHERRRFGYRRLHVLLRREGFIVNHKRLFRIYREERLLVRRRGGRKRALGTRAPLLLPQFAERPLVARFCCRSVHRWASPTYPRCGRRLHARVPGAHRRYLDLRQDNPSPAYNPSQTYRPSQRYSRRAYRRSARQTYSGNVYTPGSGPPPYSVTAPTSAAETRGPWEWHAGPGPKKRGGMCVTDVDINRGYGYQAACRPRSADPTRAEIGNVGRGSVPNGFFQMSSTQPSPSRMQNRPSAITPRCAHPAR